MERFDRNGDDLKFFEIFLFRLGILLYLYVRKFKVQVETSKTSGFWKMEEQA